MTQLLSSSVLCGMHSQQIISQQTSFPSAFSNEDLDDVIGFAVDRCHVNVVPDTNDASRFRIQLISDIAHKGWGSAFLRVGFTITAIGKVGKFVI